MKQLLLQVSDGVYRRLTARAARAGQSVNALATGILDAAVDGDVGDRRARLRARALGLGLSQSGSAPSVGERSRRRIIASTRGTSPILDALLADETADLVVLAVRAASISVPAGRDALSALEACGRITSELAAEYQEQLR